MDVSLFDYHLPQELIARTPAEERSSSRLLVIHRKTGKIEHRRFHDVTEYLESGDVLVINNTRVIPARLMGNRYPGGGKIEALLLREREKLVWETMVRPGKRVKKGDRIVFEPKLLEGEVVEYLKQGERIIHFECRGDWKEVLEKVGHTPLPPYILKARRDDLRTDLAHTPLEMPGDRERYQTVYAAEEGSIAAPTAGLHFTSSLMNRLTEERVTIAPVTLHVGAGTFKPVTAEKVEDHEMHSEVYRIEEKTATVINNARKEGRRIVPVGTTAVRTLESAASDNGMVKSGSGETDLMIAPGYSFKCVDVVITNFHLPRSTLLMLVCAFGGRELVLKAYEEAIREKYRFYSYGDAMMII